MRYAPLVLLLNLCSALRNEYIAGEKSSMASMTLHDITQTLVSGNANLFSDPDSENPVLDLAKQDRYERQLDIPAMLSVQTPEDDFFSDVWDWFNAMTGHKEKPILAYPLHTVDYLNAAVYKRETDPSDVQDPTIAGDILFPSKNTWSLWPKSQGIEFEFDIPPADKSTVCVKKIFTEAALRVSEASSGCVKLVENSSSNDKSILRIRSDEKFKCYSSLGYNSMGDNVINIGLGCRNVGTVMHLILHALGMAHEDQRPDAAQYRYVIDPNIDAYGMSPSAHINPTKTEKFKKTFVPLSGTKTRWETEIMQFPYEYGSIMHNSVYRYSYSIGSKPTTTSVFLGQKFDDLPGNRGFITYRDAQILNNMYMCTVSPMRVGERSLHVPLSDGETYESIQKCTDIEILQIADISR